MFPNLVSFLSKPSLLFIVFNLITPHPRGNIPPSVLIMHVLPCIEHRHVPLLGTSFLAPDTCLLLDLYYKALLNFFKVFKISEKVAKNKKNQKSRQEKMLSLVAVESCRLRTDPCISHPLVGLLV